MVQLGQRNSVEQRSMCSKTYPNLSPIAPLLPGMAGAPSYCGKRDITEIHPATPHIDRISPFQVYRIYQETFLQYFPNLLRGTLTSGGRSQVKFRHHSALKCLRCPSNTLRSSSKVSEPRFTLPHPEEIQSTNITAGDIFN